MKVILKNDAGKKIAIEILDQGYWARWVLYQHLLYRLRGGS